MIDVGLWRWTAILALAGCGRHDPQAHAAAPASVRQVPVARSREVELVDRLQASGTLRPEDQVVIKSEVAGRLVKLDFDLGSVLKRGQVIAQIDPEEYRLRVQQAEAALRQAEALLGSKDIEQASLVRQARATFEEAQRNAARSDSLLAQHMIGRAEAEAAQASLARAESALSAAHEEIHNRLGVLEQRRSELGLARRALEHTDVRSPIDGVIQLRNVSRGEVLAAGTSVATVVDIDPLRLRLDIPDRAAERLQLGEAVQITLEDGSRERGAIARMAPMIDEANRTLSIEAEIPNPRRLRPGSFVRAEIELGASRHAVVVPAAALTVFAGLEKVLTLEQGLVHENVVHSGRRENGMIELRSGLAADALVILEPESLQAGDAVEPREASPRAEAR